MALSIINTFLLAWLSLPAIANAYRILAVFPMAAKSHFSCNEALMSSLHKAGHQITFVSPFADHESLKNYTTIDSKSPDTFVYIGQSAMMDFQNLGLRDILSVLTETDEKYCYDVLKLKEVQDLLSSKEKKFDVMFVELLYMYECFLPLAEKLGIPVIGSVTLRYWKMADPAIGNPYNPAIVPFEFAKSSNAMTFYERLVNTWNCVVTDLYYRIVVKSKIHTFYQQHYATDLWYKKKLSLIFNNNHPSLVPRALVPNAIEIGGIHLKKANPLPENIQKFIDESEHGVILFTFGSVVKSSTMSSEMVNAFKEAFAAVPQRVIWKFEDKMDDLPENVLTMDWVPQRDILAHKNVKAFIGHCGMSGTYEAIYEGKPMVLTPLFGDQMSNAAILMELGVGIHLDMYSLTKESVLHVLNAIVNDTRYRDNMEALSRKFKDRPMTPQESVVYWTEYVIRHNGASHLRTVAADMPFYQYLLLDVALFATTVAVMLLCIVYYVVKKLYSFVCQETKYRISIEINKKTC